MKHLIPIPAILFTLVILTGCNKKGSLQPHDPTDSIGRIDKWIADSLRRYYYWSQGIPAHPDYSRSPDYFFRSLLSPSDRFSWVSNGMDIIPPSNSYFTYGFHYAFIQAPGYDGLIGVVTAINKGGAADSRGLVRGSYFLTVNGMGVSPGNMNTIKQALQTAGYVNIGLGLYENGQWHASDEIELSSFFAAESPVRYTRIFSGGGIVTGYLNYNSFNEYYDGQLMEAVGKLRQAGVSELVLDLRYNAGGSVASSAKLAGMLAGKLNGAETYVIYSGNVYEGRKSRSLQEVMNTSDNSEGRSYQDLIGKRLSLSRIFMLTTRGTVSAAELIINNLKPFLQVVQIGDTTRGKNEAGFVIADNRNPRQVLWTMEPTIYKLFNKSNEGNYEKGLIPQYQVSELSRLPLVETGAIADPLLHQALQLIYGTNIPDDYMDLRSGKGSLKVRVVYSSADDAEGIGLLTNH